MPVDWSKYPDDWKAIALAVKEEADWQCEMCGKQCRRPGESFDSHTRTATVAHCNRVESDCRPENLVCACAPCHLKYDAAVHARNAAKTRRAKFNRNQLSMFEEKRTFEEFISEFASFREACASAAKENLASSLN